MALEQFDLDGQVAIVTGAGKGVGQGIARVLAEAGATVVGTARTESDIVGTIRDIETAGGKGLALVADAMSRADGERVVKSAMERSGRIDTLVNNVGGSTYARFLDITDEDFRHTFDWCVTSAFIMSQLVAPHMLEAGHGSIVNISSGSARFGIRALTAYCVAKGGGGAHSSHGTGTCTEDPGQRHRTRLIRDRRPARQPGPDARVTGEDE